MDEKAKEMEWYLRSRDRKLRLNSAKARRTGESLAVGAGLEPGTLTGSRLTCLEGLVEGAMVVLMPAIAKKRSRELLLE